jgi:hypothetical protein
MEQISLKRAKFCTDALVVLQDALDRCRDEDMRTPEVFAALDFLGARTKQKWPFQYFREALERSVTKGWEREGRWQTLNASLNGIRLAVQEQIAGERDRPA